MSPTHPAAATVTYRRVLLPALLAALYLRWFDRTVTRRTQTASAVHRT
jgi:hypothetical protein